MRARLGDNKLIWEAFLVENVEDSFDELKDRAIKSAYTEHHWWGVIMEVMLDSAEWVSGSNETQTMGVGPTGDLFINRDFFQKLVREDSDGSTALGVFEHEALHIFNYTHSRKDRGVTRSHQLWNVATDYIMNRSLRDSGVKLPAGILMPERVGNKDIINFNPSHYGIQDYQGEVTVDITGLNAEKAYTRILAGLVELDRPASDDQPPPGPPGGPPGETPPPGGPPSETPPPGETPPPDGTPGETPPPGDDKPTPDKLGPIGQKTLDKLDDQPGPVGPNDDEGIRKMFEKAQEKLKEDLDIEPTLKRKFGKKYLEELGVDPEEETEGEESEEDAGPGAGFKKGDTVPTELIPDFQVTTSPRVDPSTVAHNLSLLKNCTTSQWVEELKELFVSTVPKKPDQGEKTKIQPYAGRSMVPSRSAPGGNVRDTDLSIQRIGTGQDPDDGDNPTRLEALVYGFPWAGEYFPGGSDMEGFLTGIGCMIKDIDQYDIQISYVGDGGVGPTTHISSNTNDFENLEKIANLSGPGGPGVMTPVLYHAAQEEYERYKTIIIFNPPVQSDLFFDHAIRGCTIGKPCMDNYNARYGEMTKYLSNRLSGVGIVSKHAPTIGQGLATAASHRSGHMWVYDRLKQDDAFGGRGGPIIKAIDYTK